MQSRSKASVAIVGPGRVGQALGKLLANAGVPVDFIAARQLASARQAARFIGRGRAVTLDDPLLGNASVFVLTVSDRALAPVAEHLSALLTRNCEQGGRKPLKPLRGKVFLHTCGSVDARVLAPLARLGAAVGSLHPFQTVPSPQAGSKNLVETFWTTEGDARARQVAKKWVRLMKGQLVRIRPERKILYHLSAFLVCPTLVTLMDRSTGFLQKVGVPEMTARQMLGAFVGETVKNFVEFGGRRSLTGPASRGDWAVIRRHRRELRHHAPELLPVYDSLLGEMLRLAGRKWPKALG